MSKKNVSNISLIALLFVYAIVYRLVLLKNSLTFNDTISAIFIMFVLFFSVYWLGFRKKKANELQNTITKITMVSIIVFFAIGYAIGLLNGFLTNAYSMKPFDIFNNIFAPIVILVCTEFFRYIIINRNKDSKFIMILAAVGITLFEMSFNVREINLSDLSATLSNLFTTACPIIVKNAVLTYVTYHADYKPCILYRLVMDVYIFVFPIVPDLGDYLTSMIGMTLPFVIYLYATRAVNDYNNPYDKTKEYVGYRFKFTDIPVAIFMVTLLCLNSGSFTYFITGIGSGSMEPKLGVGDAVIVKRVKSKNDIHMGDILVYSTPSRVVIHRLVRIDKVGDKIIYKTKGDANNDIDRTNIDIKDIKGVVKFKIPFLAYPSIYFSNYLNGK